MSSGSDAPILDYLQAQILLESTIASFAARRRTDGDLRLIKDRLVLRGEWKLGRQRSEFFERDRLFHDSISAASHNPPPEPNSSHLCDRRASAASLTRRCRHLARYGLYVLICSRI